MRPTVTLLQHSARLTLFTRAQCSLCDTAKLVLQKIRDKGREFEYREVDVMAKGMREWREKYQFDVPVVSDFYICAIPHGVYLAGRG